MLYFDDQEIVFELTRPIGFNGINLAANKADILDRGLNIELEEINENQIKLFEREIIPEFDRLKPYLLSYIFDIISKVLIFEYETESKGLELRSRSRMADWEEYGEIIARSVGLEPFQFLDAYRANREKKTEIIMEESPVAQAIVKLMVEDKLREVANGNGSGSRTQGFNQELIWTDSSSQLYAVLKPIVGSYDIAGNIVGRITSDLSVNSNLALMNRNEEERNQMNATEEQAYREAFHRQHPRLNAVF